MSVHFPESLSPASILAEGYVHHQERLELERLAKSHLETNRITIKPETASHTAEQSSWVLTLLLSTQVSFPNKISCFVRTCVSSDNSFLSVRQEPSLGPWKGSLFLQQCL